MHYGSYHTEDPAADAERYFSDLEMTYPEEDYAVDLNFRISLRVRANERDDAEHTARMVAYELLNGINDERLIDTEWLETTDIERE